jgi:hypothetical protein
MTIFQGGGPEKMRAALHGVLHGLGDALLAASLEWPVHGSH